MKIVIATKNKGKLQEIKAILSDEKYEIVSMNDMGIDIEVDEDADTFSGNAQKKAIEIMKVCNEITLADDSGLVVDALNGAPGVYSARYAGEHGDDLQNNLLLLKNMENCADRSAYYVCAIACAFPDGRSFTVRGECHGELLTAYRGEGRFGYDPLFLYTPMQKTFAEMSMQEKNAVSHRGVAAKEFTKILPKYL